MTDDMMNLRDLARESDQERDEPESCSSAQNALGWAVGACFNAFPDLRRRTGSQASSAQAPRRLMTRAASYHTGLGVTLGAGSWRA